MIFTPTLERLASVDVSDLTEMHRFRQTWAEICATDFDHFDTLYELIIDAGETLLGGTHRPDPAHKFTPKSATVFLTTVSDQRYLTGIGSRPAIQTRLARHNEKILWLIRQMTAAAKQQPELAQPVDALISLYFHHASATGDGIKLYAGVVRVLPDVLMSFPEHAFSFTLYLLTQGSDAAKDIGRIVTFHVIQRGDVMHTFCQEVANGIMGLTSSSIKARWQLGAAIMGPVARAARDQRPDIINDLVSGFVLTPLKCNPSHREAEIALLEAELTQLRGRIRMLEERLKSPTPITVQDTPLLYDISRVQKELDQIKTDFEDWKGEHWDLAVRHIASQPDKRATLEAIQTGLSPLRNDALDHLLSDAASLSLA